MGLSLRLLLQATVRLDSTSFTSATFSESLEHSKWSISQAKRGDPLKNQKLRTYVIFRYLVERAIPSDGSLHNMGNILI